MFDPEHKDIDCPKCLQPRVYLDREMGFYCMSCGYELSDEEALFLIEKVTSTARPAPDSSRAPPMPIVEVKKRRGRPAQADHISPGADKKQNKKPD